MLPGHLLRSEPEFAATLAILHEFDGRFVTLMPTKMGPLSFGFCNIVELTLWLTPPALMLYLRARPAKKRRATFWSLFQSALDFGNDAMA